EDLRRGLSQIHHNESIERVGEPRIDAEGEQLCAQFQILSDQNGNTLAIRLEIGYRGGEIVYIRHERAERLQVPFLDEVAAQRVPSFHKTHTRLCRVRF